MGIAPRCRRHLRPPQRQEEEEEKDPFHLSLSLLEDDSAPGAIWYTFLHAEGV